MLNSGGEEAKSQERAPRHADVTAELRDLNDINLIKNAECREWGVSDTKQG